MNYPTQNVSYPAVEKPCLRVLEVQVRSSTKDCWRLQASSYHRKFYSEIQDSKTGRERRTPTSNSFTSPCGQRSSHSCSSPLPQRRIVRHSRYLINICRRNKSIPPLSSRMCSSRKAIKPASCGQQPFAGRVVQNSASQTWMCTCIPQGSCLKRPR